jgi:hypothetical protein
MKEALRSAVLPVLCLLVHAPAGAQTAAAAAAATPVPQTEVFVDDARWIPASRGAVPSGAIAHGREPDGRHQYICRTRSGTGVQLGKVSQGSRGCVVVSRGRPVTAWNYEVLTELYAHAEQQPPPQSRESVIDLVRRRMVETDPANKKH